MEIIKGTEPILRSEVSGAEKMSAVAIGKFDGIHLGHQKLLAGLLEQKAQGLLTLVFTFDPPPAALFGSGGLKELTTREEKRAAFEQMGVDVLVEFTLNEQTAAMLPEDFIEKLLVGRLRARYIAAGTDVSFGNRGAGNFLLLQCLADRFGYEVRIIDKVCFGGREVSSTFVRETVEQGKMEEAEALLGAPYKVSGRVINGKRLGRTIGMPTVNLLPPAEKLLPPNGVYFSEVRYRNKSLRGITNIGCKPTVSREERIGVETYIYDFTEEIYGEELTVSLLSFKRKEQKFADTAALKEQLHTDMQEGLAFHRARAEKKRGVHKTGMRK